jgi:N-acetylglucosaminyl-diphospho-decaprenol L-rhamnosyltransferase
MSHRYEVVVVSYKSRAQVSRLLSVLPDHVPVAVVDNSANDERVDDLLRERPAARYLDTGANVGFAAAANLGARTADAPILIFVNPDSAPTEAVLNSLVDDLETDSTLASCHPALVDGTGAIKTVAGGGWQPTLARAVVHAFGLHTVLPTRGIWARPRPGHRLELEWLTGTCLAVRRTPFLDAGGFDERYFLYAEDVSLGRRLHQAGLRQVLRADLAVYHTGGASSAVASSWLWRQRGVAFGSFLTDHNGPMPALAMRLVLAFGFGLRAVCYCCLGRTNRVRELAVYAGAILSRS